MENKLTVLVQAIIDVPVEKVWIFWTQPEHIEKWNFASEDWHCPSAANDFRAEGTFCYVMASRDEKMSFEFKGTYTEIIPEQLIKYKMEDERLVTITFRKIGNQTEISESFEAENSNAVEVQKDGWDAILTNFKRYCEASIK